MEENAYQQADDQDGLFGDESDLLGDGDNADANTPAADTPAAPVNDDEDLGKMMADAGVGGDFNFDEINARPLDAGEKADDAVDYEDIELSDEELPDDDLPIAEPVMLPGLAEHAQGDINFDDPDNDDDLFGDADADGLDSFLSDAQVPPAPVADADEELPFDLASEPDEMSVQKDLDSVDDMTEEELRMFRIQQHLFEGGEPPSSIEKNELERLKLEFPEYREGETPYFNRIFPPRPGKYTHMTQPPKRKPIRPTRVILEIEQDQKMLFNSSSTGTAKEYRPDLVAAQLPQTDEGSEESSEESDIDEPLPGGITMQEIALLCANIDTLSEIAGSDVDMEDLHTRAADSDANLFGFDEFDDSARPHKKRRTGLSAHEVVAIHQLQLPSFDDPERATAKIAKEVVLDLNDPELLVEEIDPDSVRAKLKPGDKTKGNSTVKARLEERFKTSNDAEYDLLKQNHQHKIRGQLGHLTIDHSTPALRLQYPYFKYRYDPSKDLRSWKRKKMAFKFPITFNKPAKHKRKQFKGKDFKEIYAHTKDLSMADNSTSVLLEYSLEQPLIMSQVGMGNKIVNYYRRKTKEDSSRPKHELGETSVLLPEDKSPFYMFGHIEPGEEVTALYNSMYRAPIFEQEMQPRDFLVVRETTGMGGQTHYMRNVDHLFVVGQELPSTAIPGAHSRMVTTADKNRLKAISYRIARRKKNNRIRVEDVTKHFQDSTDMQNRQKMKEFMMFNKEHKEWEMKGDEPLPDEEVIRSLIRPEDVCLLEAMRVGDKFMKDAGYGSDDEDEKEKADDSETLEQLLTPWRVTKTFMQATQGKAMVRVWGEGDPSGRDEAFSFIRTNMKGGYAPRGAPIQDTLTKENNNKPGSHRYNVAEQQQRYDRDIRDTWDNQKAALSSKVEPSDPDGEGDIDAMEELRGRSSQRATPMSTPAPARQHDHETGTSFSKRSAGSQAPKFLKITRTVEEDGELVMKEYVETDAAVIKAYLRARKPLRRAGDESQQ